MFGLLIMLAIATIAFKAAEMEESRYPIAWAALSVGVYLLAGLYTGWGMCAGISAQILLLIAITLVRILKDHHSAFSPTSLKATWRRLRSGKADHPACPHCDYNLTGLPHAKACPECGKSLTVCPYCRHDLANNRDATFCPKCGKELPNPYKQA